MKKTKKISKNREQSKSEPSANLGANLTELPEPTELKTKKSFLKGIKDKLTDKYFPQLTFLIEMKHYNGTVSDFILKTNGYRFKYKGKIYIIDEERKEFSNTTKLYKLRYHEGFCMPYSIEVTAQDMKEEIERLSESDVEIHSVKTSYNPYILPDILKMEYAKGVIQGAEVHDFIKKTLIIGIINLIIIIAFFGASAYMNKWI